MNLRRIVPIVLAVFILAPAVFNTAFAEDFETVPQVVSENCGFDNPDSKNYEAEVIAVRKQLRVDAGETFRVKVFMKNKGNTPWFSGESNCNGPHMSLGTRRPQDANSQFYFGSLPDVEDTGWESANRVKMDQLRVDPGQIASFTFYSKASSQPDVLKEYFAPVLEGMQWIDDAEFSFELIVGDNGESAIALRERISYANKSGSVMDIPLDGEKYVIVDLSEQKLDLHLGDYIVKTFPVSSGKPSTPTPYGTTYIKLKQEVRVGGAPPHYIMPKFMWFRAGGYGFHALPSLGSDGGIFWTEALSHIGRPVSHGCVRLLPQDADFMYDFVEIGTRVVVQP